MEHMSTDDGNMEKPYLARKEGRIHDEILSRVWTHCRFEGKQFRNTSKYRGESRSSAESREPDITATHWDPAPYWCAVILLDVRVPDRNGGKGL